MRKEHTTCRAREMSDLMNGSAGSKVSIYPVTLSLAMIVHLRDIPDCAGSQWSGYSTGVVASVLTDWCEVWHGVSKGWGGE